MNKYSSKFYVLLILAIIMMTVSCGKIDTTEKIEVTLESSGDKAIVQETGKSENTKSSENTEPTVATEPTADAEPKVTAEPTVAAKPTVTTEPTVTTKPMEITDTIEAIKFSSLETIEETVLFDQEGVRVTAKEFITDYWGKAISVLIENDTDKNIGIVSSYLIVNNYMTMNFPFSEIPKGTKSNDVIPLSSPYITTKGIDIIAEVAISFQVFDNDSGETLFYTEETEIPTSAYGTVEQPIMEDGNELLNQDGVRIVGKYVDENSSWGTGILLYMENTTDQDILIQCDDMLINGISIYPFFLYQVNRGREALEAIDIMDFDLQENKITQIKDIGLTFSIIDPYNGNVINVFEPVEFLAGE